MRRWNGWGDDTIDVVLNEDALAFLAGRIGPGQAPLDASFDDACAAIAPSRLAPHPLVDMLGRRCAPCMHSARACPTGCACATAAWAPCPTASPFPRAPRKCANCWPTPPRNGASVIPYGGGTSVAGHLTVLGERPRCASTCGACAR